MYLMYESAQERAVYSERATRVDTLDIDAIEKACKYLIGEHDFSSFMSTGSDIKTTVRTITNAKIEKQGNEYKFFVTANGFLYNMVRKIVAGLIRVGTGKMSVEDFAKKVENPDILSLPFVAPADGLYLVSVEY